MSSSELEWADDDVGAIFGSVALLIRLLRCNYVPRRRPLFGLSTATPCSEGTSTRVTGLDSKAVNKGPFSTASDKAHTASTPTNTMLNCILASVDKINQMSVK
jgi:hypothetical protein